MVHTPACSLNSYTQERSVHIGPRQKLVATLTVLKCNIILEEEGEKSD
jgi:hypothetical protein